MKNVIELAKHANYPPHKNYTTYDYAEKNPDFQPQAIPEIPESLLYPTISLGPSIKISLAPPMRISDKNLDKLCYAAIISAALTFTSFIFVAPHKLFLGLIMSGLFGFVSLVSGFACSYFMMPNGYEYK
ncbi:MAG: hypothetical protein PHO93_01590 [Candidatus Saccharimonadaceae bacterium]|nr:hypothetical protein [Candidatus Saccharimonadaceae bacterium]